MKTQFLPGARLSALILSLTLVTAMCALQTAKADDGERVVESTHYTSGGRDARQVIRTSRDTFAATQGVDKSVKRDVAKSGQQASQSANQDFWFYSADIILFGDADFDGFYSGIDLLFDADTIYAEADVYAVVYLSFEGGAWEEYAVTDTFTIFGASDNDDYSVVTDLVSGYPTGSYDVLIELFDAFNDDFLAFIGPDDTSELSFLPLEDIGRDTPPETTVVINNEGGGGSAGLLSLFGLCLLVLLSRRLRPTSSRRVAVSAPRA
ncbi:MAG: choice-of-anchor H family protein [Woeseiaceae bacterium]|nr:choice-of-anchor H family protein [Woeseiaceae bacterium]